MNRHPSAAGHLLERDRSYRFRPVVGQVVRLRRPARFTRAQTAAGTVTLDVDTRVRVVDTWNAGFRGIEAAVVPVGVPGALRAIVSTGALRHE